MAKKKKHSLAYLNMVGDQGSASDNLGFAIERVGGRVRCQDDPKRWDADPENGDMPTIAEAAKMCEGCPVLKQCKAYGESLKPDVGIYGGIIWLDGKALEETK